jgi:hypothetical protein
MAFVPPSSAQPAFGIFATLSRGSRWRRRERARRARLSESESKGKQALELGEQHLARRSKARAPTRKFYTSSLQDSAVN